MPVISFYVINTHSFEVELPVIIFAHSADHVYEHQTINQKNDIIKENVDRIYGICVN